jgi:hypothetical protein
LSIKKVKHHVHFKGEMLKRIPFNNPEHMFKHELRAGRQSIDIGTDSIQLASLFTRAFSSHLW